MTVRFGLIGYGGIGRLHATAVRESADAELSVVCTGSASSAQQAAEELGIPAVNDYQAVIQNPDVDAVIIATPSNTHATMARQALAAEKDVLLEKPMGLMLSECDAIRADARSRGRVLFVNHELRYSPLWRRMADAVAAGLIGEPLSVAISLWRAPYRQGSNGWRYDRDRVGNWILEEPIHFFDILRWLLQRDPERVTCAGASASERGPAMVSSFASIFDFGADRFGTFHQTLTGDGHHIECDIAGRDGALRARWSAADGRSESPHVSLNHWDGVVARSIDVPVTPGESYEITVQLHDLIDAIRTRREPPMSSYNGAWAVAMCDAATASLNERATARVHQPTDRNGAA